MLLIPCPWCGPREENEFRYGGEAAPFPPPDSNDQIWSRYLYYRSNPVGGHRERWAHIHGCRRWLTLVRDTTTHEITEVLPATDPSGTVR